MLAARFAKLTMVSSLAGFAFIVTFDNLTDYTSNYAFVQHVPSPARCSGISPTAY
jgi:predicted small integral membrane protein